MGNEPGGGSCPIQWRRSPRARGGGLKALSTFSRDFVSLARSVYVANGEKFVVSFQFGKGTKRLQRVDLDAVDASNCYAYKFSLLHKYGSPTFKSADEKILVWRRLIPLSQVDQYLGLAG